MGSTSLTCPCPTRRASSSSQPSRRSPSMKTSSPSSRRRRPSLPLPTNSRRRTSSQLLRRRHHHRENVQSRSLVPERRERGGVDSLFLSLGAKLCIFDFDVKYDRCMLIA